MNDYLGSTRRTVAWIKEQEDSGSLELRPPFQRNPVWTDRQKAFLIDTVLRGYPIPELYMQEIVDEEGNESHLLVDGQQRIRACLDFIEGRFTLHPKDSPDFGDVSFDDLSPDLKKKIFQYNFIVRILPEMSSEELRNIFQRLNRNVVALNKQELRHATYWGEFIQCMEDLADMSYWDGTGVFTANDIRRMLDVEFVSEIAIGYLHGPQNKKQTLDKWYTTYEKEFAHNEDVKNTFSRVLYELESVLPDIKRTRWRQKSDFYSLFLAMAAHQAEFSLSREQRSELREGLLRFGERVTAFLTGEADAPERVKNYARGVERAASDLANRRRRLEALTAEIGEAIALEEEPVRLK